MSGHEPVKQASMESKLDSLDSKIPQARLSWPGKRSAGKIRREDLPGRSAGKIRWEKPPKKIPREHPLGSSAGKEIMPKKRKAPGKEEKLRGKKGAAH